jgi:hypothetical protein
MGQTKEMKQSNEEKKDNCDDLNVSEEELSKLLNQAGTNPRAIIDGVSGQALANQSLAKILAYNFKATHCLAKSSRKLELLTFVHDRRSK